MQAVRRFTPAFQPSVLVLLTFLLLTLIAGCAQLGLPTPQTLNEKIATAQGSVTQVRTSAAALIRAGKMSSADGENVLAQTDNASKGIEVARAVALQDPASATFKLTAVVTVLTALQTYLATKQP